MKEYEKGMILIYILSFLSFSLDLWNGNCNGVLVSFQVTVFRRISGRALVSNLS